MKGGTDISRPDPISIDRSLFSSIARKYDLLNTLLSFGLHYRWKRFAVSLTDLLPGDSALDICTGTADLAIFLAQQLGATGMVTGVDFCEEMLLLGKEKVRTVGLESRVNLIFGNVENLDFPDESFDAATWGFAMRNVADMEKVLSEVLRVLKPGKKLVCLEFSQPVSPVLRSLYDFYSFQILPRIGGLISKDFDAYSYLPRSIREFPTQEELKVVMEKVGFRQVVYYNLTGGIVATHVGTK